MDAPFIGSIFMFGGNYAPLGYSFCWGQQLVTGQNQALFAILGNMYGGNSANFNLPDLRGRVPVGYGANTITNGFNAPTIGATGGVQTVTLGVNQLPAHIHSTTVTAGSGPSSASVTLYGINGQGGQTNPGGNFLGSDSQAGAASYAAPGSGTPSAMAAGSVTISNISAATPSVTVLPNTTSGTGFSIMQPYIVINYIIALTGIWPSRN